MNKTDEYKFESMFQGFATLQIQYPDSKQQEEIENNENYIYCSVTQSHRCMITTYMMSAYIRFRI